MESEAVVKMGAKVEVATNTSTSPRPPTKLRPGPARFLSVLFALVGMLSVTMIANTVAEEDEVVHDMKAALVELDA